MKPVACIHLPTDADKLAFLKRAYAAGYNWCDMSIEAALNGNYLDCWTHMYQSRKSNGLYFGIAPRDGRSPEMVPTTLVNSAAHFLVYLKS